MPFVQAGPARLYYREFGSGTPLLFLHGGWGYEVYPFDRGVAEFSGRFRILIPDRSGYGRSPQLSTLPPHFHLRAAEETLQFLDALGIERVALWGHSDGAVIAGLLGLASPERFCALVLEAFHYTRAKHGSVDFFKTMIAEPETVGGRAIAALTRDHGEDWRKALQRNAEAWLAIVASGNGDLYGGRLSQLIVPSLFIEGSRDPRIEPGDPETVRRQLPGAEFHVIEGAGHSPHSEPGSADETVRVAARFLDRVCG
jgi:pimeloyl-ACP methyl ester carboxylesterase